MATRTCKNGHVYDSSVYGDNCPFCPSPTKVNISGGETMVNAGMDSFKTTAGTSMETKKTVSVNDVEEDGGTIIRSVGDQTNQPGGNGRKLVGLMVCYDVNPNGEVFNIYEGRNLIGRKRNCDISIPSDGLISSEHLIVLYREVEGIFWAVDNNSSNGTFVNGKFEGKVQLQTNDIITVGSTRFIFIAIPKIK